MSLSVTSSIYKYVRSLSSSTSQHTLTDYSIIFLNAQLRIPVFQSSSSWHSMRYRGMLKYPGDPRWGSVSKMTSRPKTLEQIRTQLSRTEAQQFDLAVSTLDESAKTQLAATIAYLSDEQFRLMIGRMLDLALVPGRFAFGIMILSRQNPSPIDHGLWPDVPNVTCKKRRQMDPGPEEGTVEWATLQERLKALPLELFLAIEKLSFDGAFLADVFPHQSTKGLTWKACISKDINLRALGLINRSSYMEYANRAGIENLWVISPGPADPSINFLALSGREYSMDWLANPPTRRAGRVRRVHLAFTRADTKFGSSFVAKMSNLNFPHTRGYSDRWLLFMEFDVNNENVLSQVDRDLLNTWKSKASHVFLHALEEVTLDFRNACGADGSFLGEQFVDRLQHFMGGILPKVLIIEAPTSAIADAIRRMIVDKNDQYRRQFGM